MSRKQVTGRRRRLVQALAALLLLGTSMPARAFDPAVTEGIRFQVNCAILMLTNPDEHVRVCNPKPIPSATSSLSDLQTGAPATPPPPPPPPPPSVDDEDDECPSGQEPTPCGCAYPGA